MIVVDAGSTDATRAVAAGYAGDGVKIESVGPAYPGLARNRGIAVAAYDWAALIDAGCFPDPRWLEYLVAVAEERPEIPVVFGDYGPSVGTEWEAAQALSIVRPPTPDARYRGPSTASMLIHRDAWRAAGGFPEDLRAAEDLVFFRRLEAAGLRSTTCPSARVRWSLAPGPAAAFRRLRLYSRHHLAAGLFATWHRRVIVMDLVGLLLVAASAWWPPALLVAAGGGVARVVATVAARRTAVTSPFRPDRLLRVALLLCLADVAVWTGLVGHVVGRSNRGQRCVSSS